MRFGWWRNKVAMKIPLVLALALTLSGCATVSHVYRPPLRGLRIAETAVVVTIAWQLADNRFAHMNRFADAFESRLPRVFQYNYEGDPITWLQHAAWVGTATVAGVVIARATHAPMHAGARDFACGAASFYITREVYGGYVHVRQHGWDGAWRRPIRNPYTRPSATQVGWLADGIGDTLGSLGICTLTH